MKKRVIVMVAILMSSLATLVALEVVSPGSNQTIVTERKQVVGGVANYHKTGFRDDPRHIYIADRETGEKRLIYRSPKSYVDRISLSPNRRLISAIEPEDSVRNRMVIIDPQGKILYSIDDDVRRYVWSPDGSQIAYIAGTYYEGGVGFKTTGVYIFDLEDGGKKQITKDFPHPALQDFEGGGYDLNWALHDSNLYVQEFEPLGGNYRYNTKTGKTERVPYKGIHFSPDGKYYLALSSEDHPRLYVSSTNEEITDRAQSKLGYLPRSWMSDQKHHMLAVKVEYEPTPEDTISSGRPRAVVKGERKVIQKTFFIYDVEKDQVIKEWVEKP